MSHTRTHAYMYARSKKLVRQRKGLGETERETPRDWLGFGYCFTPTDTEVYQGRLVTLY
jgi:hypothetical protein